MNPIDTQSARTLDDLAFARFEAIDSTSLHARRLVDAAAEPLRPTVFVARTQSGGIGRLGRSFVSPVGGFWGTLLWPVADGTEGGLRLDTLGARLGWATLAAVRELLTAADADPGRALWKWPNDVLVDGRKVLGVLTETVGRGPTRALLVGVGCNVNVAAADLPADDTGGAASLRELTGRESDLGWFERVLLAGVVEAIATPVLKPAALGILRAGMAGLGTEIAGRQPGGALVFGTLAGADDEGRPVIRTAGGRLEPVVNVDWPSGW